MNKKDILNLNFDFKQNKSKGGVTNLIQITHCNGINLSEHQAYQITNLLKQMSVDAQCQSLIKNDNITYKVTFVSDNIEKDEMIKINKKGNKKTTKKLAKKLKSAKKLAKKKAHKKITGKKAKAYIIELRNKLIFQLEQSLLDAVNKVLESDDDSDSTTLALKHNRLPVHLHDFLILIPAEYERTDKHDVYKFDAKYNDNDTYHFDEHYNLLDELQILVDNAGENAGMVSYLKEDNEVDVHGDPHAVDIEFSSVTIINYR